MINLPLTTFSLARTSSESSLSFFSQPFRQRSLLRIAVTHSRHKPLDFSFLPPVQRVMKCFTLSFVLLAVAHLSVALSVPDLNGLVARQVVSPNSSSRTRSLIADCLLRITTRPARMVATTTRTAAITIRTAVTTTRTAVTTTTVEETPTLKPPLVSPLILPSVPYPTPAYMFV